MQTSVWIWVWGLLSCSVEPNERCRLTPERCQGGPGGFCRDHDDCATELCCALEECGHGMCTFACDADADCPSPMRCHAGHCFYDCASEQDCADGMLCESEGVCLHEAGPGKGKPGKDKDEDD
jgi:hypothetical protein